jgi:hypothetical protein
MDHVVNMHEAKSQLSKLVALASTGQVGDHRHPRQARRQAVPIKPQPVFGLMQGKWPSVPWASFAPMSDEEAAEWGFEAPARHPRSLFVAYR